MCDIGDIAGNFELSNISMRLLMWVIDWTGGEMREGLHIGNYQQVRCHQYTKDNNHC
jgi:hypothetical protein